MTTIESEVQEMIEIMVSKKYLYVVSMKFTANGPYLSWDLIEVESKVELIKKYSIDDTKVILKTIELTKEEYTELKEMYYKSLGLTDEGEFEND